MSFLRPFNSERFVLFAAIICALAATLHAQMHHVDAPEKVTRAVGVYEWTGDIAKPTSARLVPVSLFIESQFQDAGTYYARPMPLALLNGNVYELDKAGITQGNFTVDYARHLQAATSSAPDSLADLGWFGYGVFNPLPPAKKAPALQASRVQPQIVGSKGSTSSDDDRPTLSRNADPATKGTEHSTTAGSVTPPPPSDDPDRPHFGRKPADTSSPGDAGNPSTQTTTTTTTTAHSGDTSADDDNDRPTLRRRDPKQAQADKKAHDEGRVIASPGSLNDDPNRPTIRRGTPAELAGPPKQLTGVPAQLHQLVAVSDAVNREPHDFAREWESPAEQAEILGKMQALARTQLTKYAQENGAAPAIPTATPVPSPHRTAKRGIPAHAAPAAPAASFTEEQLRGFTLSYGGLPTFVYTAIAPSTAVGHPDRYVAVVTQRLPSGELQLALTSATDAAHLDRTPWMRFVDVVDPDASHRASLLFELRAHTGRQFALYRILSARAEQIFSTNPGE